MQTPAHFVSDVLQLIDHLLAGIEDVVGYWGQHYWKDKLVGTFILLSLRWDMQVPVGGSKYQFLIVFSSGHHLRALLYRTVCTVCACVCACV